MSIEWLRDLIICIMGLVATGVFIFIAVLAYSLYRRVKPILEAARVISNTLAQALALFHGMREVVAIFSRFVGKKGRR